MPDRASLTVVKAGPAQFTHGTLFGGGAFSGESSPVQRRSGRLLVAEATQPALGEALVGRIGGDFTSNGGCPVCESEPWFKPEPRFSLTLAIGASRREIE